MPLFLKATVKGTIRRKIEYYKGTLDIATIFNTYIRYLHNYKLIQILSKGHLASFSLESQIKHFKIEFVFKDTKLVVRKA